jgi:hypothetical protein
LRIVIVDAPPVPLTFRMIPEGVVVVVVGSDVVPGSTVISGGN